jgi:serralysin
MINGTVQWTPGANRVFMTLWDGGGVDTYDLSNYSGGVQIDLRPGRWTTLLETQRANLGDGNDAPGHVANALLFNGDTRSLIENAIGGTGPDRIIANEAANSLTGGGGSDRFQWVSAGDSGPARPDTILDFAQGQDKIDLSAIDANSITSADESFAFIGTEAFTGRSGEVRYSTQSGDVHVFADLNGDRVADLEIVVADLSSLSGADFVF